MELEKKTFMQQELLNQLSSQISSHIGIYFPPEQAHALEKKILPALPELGCKDLVDCIDSFLQKRFTKMHLNILAKYLTIGETYFFRDKNAFAMLKEVILPEIIAKHQNSDRTIRLWTAASATGEEPYSLAILLRELIPSIEKWNIQIIATDLNPLFLKKAREGRYKSWSFRSTPKEIFDRYFKKAENGDAVLLPSIRNMVRFYPLNLIEGPYYQFNPELKNLDLIVCNNVLIYFSPEQIKWTVKNLSLSLVKEGWLCVSSVEVPFINDSHLSPVIGHKTTAFKKALPLVKKTESIKEIKPVKEHPKKSEDLSVKKPLSQEEFYECCLSMYRSGFYSEVILQLAGELTPNKYQNPSLKKHLKELKLLIYALANQGKFAAAKNWCELALKAHKLDPELHYLYATVLQFLGEEENSQNALRAALYLDPDMVSAHFSMAMMLLKKNNKVDAKRHFDIILKLLQKMQSSDYLVGMENVTAGALNAIILEITKGDSDG